ncbi:MAG TPA: universal stress protein [Ktedonobacterales bacterium]|nr:universal stress protein [Ktedonobacterales bacterium]
MEKARHETHDMRNQPTPNQAYNEDLGGTSAETTAEPSAAQDAPSLADSAAPLGPLASYLARVEARQRGSLPEAGGKDIMAEQRRGRIEAETRRISEEVTRAAQARLQARQPQSRLTTPTREQLPAGAPTAERTSEQAQPIAHAQTITRVIAPLDGSATAERALPYAEALAHLTGATLLLTSLTVPRPSVPVDKLAALDDRLEGIEAVDSAPSTRAFDPLSYLTTIRARIALPTVELETLDADSVVAGLVELTQAHGGDVIVVAPHHRSMVHRLAFGRVVDGLIQHGGIAALIVPPQPGEAPAPTLASVARGPHEIAPAPSFRRVLIPVDGSALAESAIAPLLGLLASEIGDANDGARHDVMLLRVAESYPTLPDAEQYVVDLCEDLRALSLAPGITWSAAALVGSPPEAIAAAAERGVLRRDVVSGSGVTSQPFDLVVMATHGRGGFTRWLYGSVAAYVLEHIETPTLLTHPPVSEEDAR